MPRSSTAAPELAFTARVAGVLTFPEEFLVGHDWLARVKRCAMLHVVLVVGHADHESSRLGDPVKYDTNLTHECLRL